ncbi:phage tail fiber domain-containing protein [Pseudomonas oryzihabitans]|uniref:phage tail fiber domain-containing protein n=1 Tax=Pseudomonas oryzihabitans TaxID=47885 RepID=UPI00289CFC0F|nr:phage tail fiber protein [Pseudomonas oryzihabitans]
MAVTTVYTYPLDGSKRDFTVPFEYLARKFVAVTLVGSAGRKLLVLNTDYRFTSKTSIQTTQAWGAASGYNLIEVRRDTSATDRLVTFADGSTLRATDMTLSQVQTMHVAEEARNSVSDTISVNSDGMLDARARRLVNVPDAVDDGDAVNLGMQKRWAATALNYSTAAEGSAKAAKESEVIAGNQAAIAAGKADSADISARNTKISETNAKASADKAKASEDSVKGNADRAATSETNAGLSASNAELKANQASASATEAKGYAAGLNFPSAAGNGGKYPRQKKDASGFEYIGIPNRNYLINGAMEIAQRGTSFSTTNGYTLDRWIARQVGSGGQIYVYQLNDTASEALDYGAKKFARVVCNVVGSMSAMQFAQRIERVNSLVGTVTVSAKIRRSTGWTGSVQMNLTQKFNGTADLLLQGPTTTALTTSWQTLSWTFQLPNMNGKSLGANHSLEVALQMNSPVANQYIEVTDFKIEQGDIATDYIKQNVHEELQACQRYFCRVYGTSQNWTAHAASATFSTTVFWPVQLRGVPIVSYDLSGVTPYNCSVSGFNAASRSSARFIVTASAAGGCSVDMTDSNYWQADAEL